VTGRYDYVVIGAGAAGCVLAERLSADPAIRVALVEAGGPDSSPLYRIPLGIGRLRSARGGLWRYATEPEAQLAGRSLELATGRVIGGSASINGMVYQRAPAADYEHWRALGDEAWGAAAAAAHFAALESDGLAPRAPAEPHPLDRAFVAACAATGIAASPELADSSREAAGLLRFNIRGGQRHSVSQTHLTRARRRGNLAVLAHALARRVIVENGRALAVEIERHGRRIVVGADREIIVAAGALRSPQLLMLSGIGPPQALARLGIPLAGALPGVGANLQNHVDVSLRYACTRPVTLHSLLRAERILPAMLRAWLFGSGPATHFPGEAAAFVRSAPSEALPDLMCHLVHGFGIRGIRWPWSRPPEGQPDGEGFSCKVMLLRPESRGALTLRSLDPSDAPHVRFASLSKDDELRRLAAGVRRMRAVFASAAFDGLRGDEIEPGAQALDDRAIEEWIRARAEMQCHPVGTCAMGRGPEAVVDCDLRVHGIDRLRVADASVMPRIVAANVFATTVMIGQAAADRILRSRSSRPAAA
jgi:choline dehydrogenase